MISSKLDADEQHGDYVIHAKLKNNNLLRRIQKTNLSVAAFCREHGLSQSLVGDVINLKAPAITPRGNWRQVALDLADALSCEPDDLFVDEQKTVRLAENEAFIEMSREQVLAMADPRSAIEGRELFNAILANSDLTEREEKILRLKYESDMGPQEIAESLGVTRARVDQIEARALKRLRKNETSIAVARAEI